MNSTSLKVNGVEVNAVSYESLKTEA